MELVKAFPSETAGSSCQSNKGGAGLESQAEHVLGSTVADVLVHLRKYMKCSMDSIQSRESKGKRQELNWRPHYTGRGPLGLGSLL